MGDIKVGDALFDEIGNICYVTSVFDIVQSPELYRFTFDDGTEIDSCKDHLWKTYTAKDLAALTRRNDEWRAKRRAKRPSRAMGNKSEAFVKSITERNKNNHPALRTPPEGTVKTTLEIVKTLTCGKSNRANHAIKVAGALELPNADFQIDPYLLGLWLGDGTGCSGTITTADEELTKNWINIPSQKYLWRVPGLTHKLKALGVFKNKHVPDKYLRGSREQRLALLQGLMDTDGTVNKKKNGNSTVEFNNTDECLVDAVIELACSLGHKPGKKTKSPGVLNGKVHKDCYSVIWTPPEPVFRLHRKKELQQTTQRRTNLFRYIKKAEQIESRPGRCIQVSSPSRLYLAGTRMIPTHNTYSLLLEPIKHILSIKGFGAVIFRRTTPQIRNEGGLWDTSKEIYSLVAEPRESTLEWIFQNGNKIKFAHLEYEKNVLDWQGSQIALICFDELTHFTQQQFFYMLSRNRSTCGIKPYIRATTNPDSNSWVAKFISWWIDEETGYPLMERSGVLRWFIRIRGEIIWGSSKTELLNDYPGSIPKSVTFIPASLADNKILEKKDPGYRANLQALSLVDNERLEKGNWKIKPEAGTMFRREWFEIIDELPLNLHQKVRFYDMAGTEKSKKNTDPDWTAGCKMARDNEFFYIIDIVHVQMNPSDTDNVIKKTLEIDGYEVAQRMEQEPGSSGKKVIEDYTNGIFRRYNFEGTPSTGSKVVRANRFSAAAGAKRIKLLRGPWIEAFISEAEHFPDGPHDDIVDAASGAYNYLSSGSTGPVSTSPRPQSIPERSSMFRESEAPVW
jgi:predicted phage terminase large subunit-like protein